MTRAHVAIASSPQRLAMGLASMFGVVALFLSALGLYGVLAYVVARKTREIGIRMALGSTPRGIFRLFFSEGLLLVAAGLGLGLLRALGLGRALEGQVFGVRPTDPVILGTVAVRHGRRRAARLRLARLSRGEGRSDECVD